MLLSSLALITLSPTARLENRTWEATAWRENGAIVHTVAPITATFTPKNTISGSTGCNLYSGTYQLKGSRFSLAQSLITTKRACTPGRAEQESLVLDALRGGQKLTFDPRGNLILRYKTETGTGSITLADDLRSVVDHRATLLPSLANTKWRLVAIETGSAASEVTSNKVALSFGPNGTVTVLGTCNTTQANYVQKLDRLTLSNFRSTLRSCLPANPLEAKFFEGLGKVDRFDVDANKTQLTLIHPQGKLIFGN
jgi:heat shock protein HslJ